MSNIHFRTIVCSTNGKNLTSPTILKYSTSPKFDLRVLRNKATVWCWLCCQWSCYYYMYQSFAATYLSEISKWSKQWLVTFNPDKTEVLYFGNCQPPLLEFNNTVLSTTFDHKHIGVTLSDDCKWHTHINNMCCSSSNILGIMRTLKFTFKRNTLNQIYNSCLRPILEYSSVVWDNCSKYEKDRLERMQLEAARIVTGTTRSISTIKFILKLVG